VVLRQETFSHDLEQLLFPGSNHDGGGTGFDGGSSGSSSFVDSSGDSGDSGGSAFGHKGSGPGSSGSSDGRVPSGGLGGCGAVAAKRHNSGDDGAAARSHLPPAVNVAGLLRLGFRRLFCLGLQILRRSFAHWRLQAFYKHHLAKMPKLLCRIVDLLLQDFICFDYPVPASCRD
jgi:hypothetical protein